MKTLLSLIIPYILGAIFITIGFLSRKYPQLIAGYDKKKPLSQDTIELIKNSLIIAGLTTIVGCTVFGFLNWFFLFYIFLIAPSFAAPIFFGIKTKSSTITVVFLSVILVLIIAFGYYSLQEPMITTDNDKATISGLYGETLLLNDIKQIDLTDSIPRIGIRTNGFSLGEVKKGYFRLEGVNNVKLFLSSDQPPFIIIKTTDRILILNHKEPSSTKADYENIKHNCSL